MTASEPDIQVIRPRWNAPERVRALTTLRRGGVSTGPFAGLNLGSRAGDEPGNVARNRLLLRSTCNLPGEPVWLKQVHGTRCIDLSHAAEDEEADGSYTDEPGRVCAVLTADCLPLFVSDANGERVGLFHVGWRGLAAGIVEQALSIFAGRPDVLCWLGPSIGPAAFEIGLEVREALEQPGNETCFTPSQNAGHWMADLYRLVVHRLHRGDVRKVGWDETACTYSDTERFFSYRRSRECGRMASLIWIDAGA